MQHGGLKCFLKILKHFCGLASLPAQSKTVAKVFGCDSRYLGVSIPHVQVKPGFSKVLSIPCWKPDPFHKPQTLKKATPIRLLGSVRRARGSACCTGPGLLQPRKRAGISVTKARGGFSVFVGVKAQSGKRKRMLSGH